MEALSFQPRKSILFLKCAFLPVVMFYMFMMCETQESGVEKLISRIKSKIKLIQTFLKKFEEKH